MKTTNEVAEILGLTRTAVLYHIKKEHLNAKKYGPSWIIDDEAIENFRQTRRKPGRPVTTGAGLRRRRQNKQQNST